MLVLLVVRRAKSDPLRHADIVQNTQIVIRYTHIHVIITFTITKYLCVALHTVVLVYTLFTYKLYILSIIYVVRTTATHVVIVITLLAVFAVESIMSQQPALRIEPPQPNVLCVVVITQPTLKAVNFTLTLKKN